MRPLLCLIMASALWAQAPPPAPPEAGAARPQRRMPEPKNLQVLKVPPGELIGVMRMWAGSLGVQCNFCHVQGDFAADDKPTKITARKMYGMMTDINTRYADLNVKVGCYTCHRGKTMPEVNPPPAAERPATPPPPPQPQQ